MVLAVLGHQPYETVRNMSNRELDTLESVIKEVNKAKGGKRARSR